MYGSGVMGCNNSRVNELRKLASKVISPTRVGKSRTLQFVLEDAELPATSDPMYEATTKPNFMWARAVWDGYPKIGILDLALRKQHARIREAKSPWAAVR